MANEIVRATFKRTVHGEAHYNVLHFRWDLAGSDPEVIYENLRAAILNTGANGLNVTMRQAIQGGTAVQAIGLNLQIIHPTPIDAVEYPFPAYTPTAGETLPTFCAVVHSVRTGLANRSKRGRFFIGGIPEAQTTGNVIAQTYSDIHQGINNSLRDWFKEGGVNYNGFSFGIWSRKLMSFQAATSVTHSNVIATLRRRKTGRGI